MNELKYKVGDRVRIKSIDWYNENKNKDGNINCGYMPFTSDMSIYCGAVLTICDIKEEFSYYYMKKCEYMFTDEMIEGLVEEESEKKLSDESWKPSKEEMDVLYSLAYITNQYDEHKEEIITRLYQDLKREFFNGSSYENMFPDTEDDVRRRSTIQVLEYARSLDNYNQYGKEDIDKNIAWLEKQGKSALEVRTDNELVEEEAGLVDNLSSRWVNEFNLPDGYIFKDERGNEIHATKIVLEKANTLKTQSDNMEIDIHRGYCTTEPETTSEGKKVAWFTFGDNDFADKVELDLSNRELIQEDGKWFVVKKKKEYPKTYEECCEVLSIPSYYKLKYSTYEHGYHEYSTSKKLGVLQFELNTLSKLLICRNAYWKLYGEEMGLGKPWEPPYGCEPIDTFCLQVYHNRITKVADNSSYNCILTFPTEEMRDAFYENFKGEIEQCKELL